MAATGINRRTLAVGAPGGQVHTRQWRRLRLGLGGGVGRYTRWHDEGGEDLRVNLRGHQLRRFLEESLLDAFAFPGQEGVPEGCLNVRECRDRRLTIIG